MSIFNIFRQPPPPPPPPIYQRKPIATIAVVLTIIGMFVLGPVGAIYNGMTEELKKKADYDTVILILKQQKENDDRQWKEIERNRSTRQQTTVMTPKILKLKVVLTPQEFKSYMEMSSVDRSRYKKYLESTGKDVSSLPD